MKYLKSFILISIVWCSCSSDETVNNLINQVDFELLLAESDYPRERNNLQVLDGLLLDNEDILIIVGTTLYKGENNTFNEKLQGILSIVQSDNKIYALGLDKLYISSDDGETFTVQNNFFSSKDPSFTTFNGYPDHLLIRKLNDGRFLLLVYNQYTYNLGGTGFSQQRYENYVFTSANGIDWEIKTNNILDMRPACITNDGVIYIEDNVTDAQTYSYFNLHQSVDLGVTTTLLAEQSIIPNCVSAGNQLYAASWFSNNERNESRFHLWNGNDWQQIMTDYTAFPFVTAPERAHFTSNGQLVLITSSGIYRSLSSLP